MIEIKNNPTGQIQIADEVIAIIAGTATLETDGVYDTVGNLTGDIAGIFGQKNFAKGVKIEVEENNVKIDINISSKFGYKLHEVSNEVQKRVKQAIETMTALEVSEVNVNVVSVQMVKEKAKDKDIEEKI